MNLYETITNAIIAQLESGIIPWRKPWAGIADGAISHATGRAYSLLNQLLLKPGEYATFKQVNAEGGRVKKGAKSHSVFFWKVQRYAETDDKGNIVTDANGLPVIAKAVPILRYYTVFHLDDCEGIKPRFTHENHSAIDPIGRAETVLADYARRDGITIENEKGDKAYYSPSLDLIHLPLFNQFDSAAEYYSAAFHEATHSTGHPARLARFTHADHFGGEEYSKEELVAEIGAACVLHQLGIETPDSFRNSAAYIQSWLRALRNDKRMIVSAASRAEKAVERIMDASDALTPEAFAALVG